MTNRKPIKDEIDETPQQTINLFELESVKATEDLPNITVGRPVCMDFFAEVTSL